MTRTRIKICGITRSEDALAAVEAGADAIGMVLWPGSKRAIEPEAAAEIAAVAGPFVTVVGLFVSQDAEFVRAASNTARLNCLQFHGDESPEYCARFSLPWIKALRAAPGCDLDSASSEYPGACGILLDSYDPAEAGGTGKTFDWARVPDNSVRPLILAGGLHAGNVAAALRQVRPWAVDVSSGVESAPGIKDHHKIREFVDAVAAVDRDTGNSV